MHAATGVMSDAAGNVLELSQTIMRGYFAVIVAVEFDGPIEPEEVRQAIAG